MYKKIVYKFFIATFLFFTLAPVCYGFQTVNDNTKKEMMSMTDSFIEGSGYQKATSKSGLADIVSMVIKAFLGLLGIIFVVLLLNAGYKWMTAQGEEEKVRKAKDEITRAIIGLIIIICSYSVTYFVFKALDDVVK